LHVWVNSFVLPPKGVRATIKAIASLSLIAITTGGILGQTSPAFEVASVRLNRTVGGRPSAEVSPGGERFAATNMSLGGLIVIAYGVTPRQVSPLDSITHEKYDIQGKADHVVARDRMMRMLQSLLEDRFKLRIRREMRELPAYALVVGKHGPKLRLSNEQLPWTLSRARWNEKKSGRILFENESMPDFASVLSTLVVIGRVVVDRTGLKGNYDFDLTFTPPDPLTDPATSPDAPSIFTAVQEQLGLRLEPQRAPIEFLVIEHVERPSEN
jgi:uncharacterized protein (TIGR03435 family)